MVAHLAAIYLTIIRLTPIRSARRVFWISRRLRATISNFATGMAARRTKLAPAIMRAILGGTVAGGACSRRMRIVHARLDAASAFVKRMLPGALRAVCRAARSRTFSVASPRIYSAGVAAGSACGFWADNALHTRSLIME